MTAGYGICIPNPRGEAVDALLVKEFDYHVPANATDIVDWTEFTGNAACTNYSITV
jgi:hypothetical protein